MEKIEITEVKGDGTRSNLEILSKHYHAIPAITCFYSFKKLQPPFFPGQVPTLVLESIAYPYMDFQKSTIIHLDIYDFWMSIFNSPYKCGYPH